MKLINPELAKKLQEVIRPAFKVIEECFDKSALFNEFLSGKEQIPYRIPEAQQAINTLLQLMYHPSLLPFIQDYIENQDESFRKTLYEEIKQIVLDEINKVLQQIDAQEKSRRFLAEVLNDGKDDNKNIFHGLSLKEACEQIEELITTYKHEQNAVNHAIQGNFVQADLCLETAIGTSPILQSDLYHERAFTQLQLGKIPDAEKLLMFAMQLDKDNAIFYLSLSSLRIEQGRLQEGEHALKTFDHMLSTFNTTTDIDERKMAIYFSNWAEIKRQQGDLTDAMKRINEVVKKYLDFAAGYFVRACIYEDLKQFDAAEKDLKRSIEFAPNTIQYYFRLAKIQIKLIKYDEALANTDEVLRLNPDYMEIYGLRADAKVGKGDVNAGIEEINKQINSQPTSDAFCNRAAYQLMLHQFTAALVDINQAIALNPNDPEYFQLKQIIESSIAAERKEQELQLKQKFIAKMGGLYLEKKYDEVIKVCTKLIELCSQHNYLQSWQAYDFRVQAKKALGYKPNQYQSDENQAKILRKKESKQTKENKRISDSVKGATNHLVMPPPRGNVSNSNSSGQSQQFQPNQN